MEVASTSPDIDGVVLLMSFPWYSIREWSPETTLLEKEKIAAKITELDFNKRGGKFLVAVGGDTHMLAYETGIHNEEYGNFPIF